MIKLSIIVPFYNVEPYIEECIRSLYHQDLTQSEYEVICVDDCSPDQSASIIQSLQAEFSTLHLIRHERNKKLGGARNTGIRAAKGLYLLFVDSDDMLRANCLKQLVDEMNTQHDDYIHFNLSRMFPNGKNEPPPQYNFTDAQMSGPDLFFCKTIPWDSQISACSKIYRTDFLRSNNLYFVEDLMYEDNDYAMRVAATAKRCRHLDVAPYIYRQLSSSTTHNENHFARIMYWQATWPHIVGLVDTAGKQDTRFVDLIKSYMYVDFCHVLDRSQLLSKEQQRQVKKNLSLSEWLRYLRLIPLKRRIKFMCKLISM